MAIDHERRGQTRIHPEKPVFADYPELRPRVRDISLAGAYIEDPRPLARGRMLQLRLQLDERTTIAARAMVRRSDPGVGMGVEFLVMSDEDTRRLHGFVGVTSQVERL